MAGSGENSRGFQTSAFLLIPHIAQRQCPDPMRRAPPSGPCLTLIISNIVMLGVRAWT